MSRRRPTYGCSNQVNYRQRLLWEQEAKACGFPMKAVEKQTHSRSKTYNAMIWRDSGWNTRSSLSKNWKCQRKVRKQWMR